jgi:2-phosphosulfolactate phosphatase
MDHRFVGIPELVEVPPVAVVVDVMRAFTVAAPVRAGRLRRRGRLPL